MFRAQMLAVVYYACVFAGLSGLMLSKGYTTWIAVICVASFLGLVYAVWRMGRYTVISTEQDEEQNRQIVVALANRRSWAVLESLAPGVLRYHTPWQRWGGVATVAFEGRDVLVNISSDDPWRPLHGGRGPEMDDIRAAVFGRY